MRLRFILISGGVARLDLDDMTMDALVVNDWLRQGASAWSGEGQTSAMKAMMGKLGVHLSPAAQIMIRGFGKRAMWPSLLSQLAGAGALGVKDVLPLKDSINITEGLESARVGMTKYGQVSLVPMADGEGHILQCQYTVSGATAEQANRILVISDDGSEEISEKLKQEVVKQQPGTVVDMKYLADDGLDGDQVKEDLWDLIVNGSGESPLPRLNSIVFLGGINDTTTTGEVAFQRLLSISQALKALSSDLDKLHEDDDDSSALDFWVVTEGVYAGRIRPEQAIIQVLTAIG